jgi:ribosomal protein S18 acetylase RimI-like enzyme
MMRQAGMADLDRLAALEDASFICDGVDRRAMAGFLRSSAALVLLDASGDQLRGHVIVRFNARHRIARIYSIAVAAHCQGQGVGRALVQAAEAAALARGRVEMRLEISVDNAASQALFRACGYRVFGRYEDYYEDGGAALRLHKRLAPAPHAYT